MKKIILLSVFVISLVFVSCKDNASAKINTTNLEQAKERDNNIKAAPVAEFDQTEYDFGEITEGDVIEGSFKLTNAGETDLIVTSAKATCGCTVPDWPKQPIKPGETAEVKFKFSSKNRTGKQTKSITLKTNTEKINEVLRIKGNVIAKS
ncbi:MAG TPA: DUF1573 domain-containing protein [Flavobacteriaceae bacterium]|nr:DUF1573 domain-containing protein [Flavobacteriaceae bacterium]